MTGFRYEKDGDGIVIVTMDMAGPVNAMNEEYLAAMGETLDRLEAEPGLTGIILASAKKTFFAGGDIKDMIAAKPQHRDAFFDNLLKTKAQLRRLERLEVPKVAAINGAALGGGYEICLVCNHRIVVNTAKAMVGLPEIHLGLLPGGGGTVRLVRLLGVKKALPLLLSGARCQPAAALAAGLVDASVDKHVDLIAAARTWIKTHAGHWRQPWDAPAYEIPGGTANDADVSEFIDEQWDAVQAETRGLLPAPERIIAVASISTLVSLETALEIEGRAAADLTLSAEAKNIMTSMFYQINAVRKNTAITPDSKDTVPYVLGLVGTGDDIAQFAGDAKQAGIHVLHAHESTTQVGDASFFAGERRLPDLSACDVVLLALPECNNAARLLYRTVAQGIESERQLVAILNPRHGTALPAQGLAALRTFSATGRFELAEVTAPPLGELGHKLMTLLGRMGKMAIQVAASSNGFAQRVFSAYRNEAERLAGEGLPDETINYCAWSMGMRAAPLPGGLAGFSRRGRVFAVAAGSWEQEIKDRLMFRPVIEALRCLEEQVVQNPGDANIASLFSVGAPAWTGGFIQLVNTYDPERFCARARELVRLCGSRFTVPPMLRDQLERGSPLL